MFVHFTMGLVLDCGNLMSFRSSSSKSLPPFPWRIITLRLNSRQNIWEKIHVKMKNKTFRGGWMHFRATLSRNHFFVDPKMIYEAQPWRTGHCVLILMFLDWDNEGQWWRIYFLVGDVSQGTETRFESMSNVDFMAQKKFSDFWMDWASFKQTNASGFYSSFIGCQCSGPYFLMYLDFLHLYSVGDLIHSPCNFGVPCYFYW